MKSFDVPQANSLDRVRAFVEAVKQGAAHKKQVQAGTGLSARHADYYGQAARLLGYLERTGETYRMLEPGAILTDTRSGSAEELDAFRAGIARCEAVREVAPDLLESSCPDEDALTQRITNATDLAPKTARRRAQALLMWRTRVLAAPSEASEGDEVISLFVEEDAEPEAKPDERPRLSARVDALGVRDFKGLRSASIDFGALTVLVGSNGAGKTSLRDVFRFLHAVGRGYSLAEAAGERWGDGTTPEWTGIRGGPRELVRSGLESFALEVQIAVPDGAQLRPARFTVEVQVPAGTSNARVVRERLEVDGRGFVYDSHPESEAPVQVPNRLAVRVGRSSRTSARGPVLLADPRKPVLAQVGADPAVRTRSVTDAAELVRCAFRDIRFLDLDPNAMRRPSLPDQTRLGDRGENLPSVLHAIMQQVSTREVLLHGLKAFTSGAVHNLAFENDAGGRLSLTLQDPSGRPLSAHSVSDGTLEFLGWQAALLGPDSPSFWFFDDFDAGLCPDSLPLMVELLERQVIETHRQVVATARHPRALDALDLDPKSMTTAYRLQRGSGSSAVRTCTPAQPAESALDEDAPPF